MKLILHIGQSKTGTSSLQGFLQANRKSLAKQGILYPEYIYNGRYFDTQSHNIFAERVAGFSVHPHCTPEDYFQQFHRQLKEHNCDTMILSAENFFGAPHVWRIEEGQDFFDAHRKKLEVLRGLTQDFDTHIVAYLRPPEIWFEAAITQIIRYHGLLGQEVYQSDPQLFSLLAPHMDYARLLGLWRDVLKPAQMSVMPYEREKMVQNDTIYDFFARAGLDISAMEKLAPKPESHASLDRRYVAVKKELNKTPKSKVRERIIIACLGKLNDGLKCIEKYKADPDLKEEIRQYSAASNQRIQEEYGDQDNESFFTPLALENGEQSAELSVEKLEAAMQQFHKCYKSFPIRVLHCKFWVRELLKRRFKVLYMALRVLARPFRNSN